MESPRRKALKRLQAELARQGVKLSINRLDEILKRFGALAVKAIRKTPHGRPNALYVLAEYPENIETLAVALTPLILQKHKVRGRRFVTLWDARTKRGSFRLLYRGKQLALGYGDYVRSDVYFLSIDEVKQLIKLMNSYRKSYTKGTSLSLYRGAKGVK